MAFGFTATEHSRQPLTDARARHIQLLVPLTTLHAKTWKGVMSIHFWPCTGHWVGGAVIQ